MAQHVNQLFLSKICEDAQLEKLYKEADSLYTKYNGKIKKASKVVKKKFLFDDFFAVFIQFYVYIERIHSGQSVKQAVPGGLSNFFGNPNFLLLTLAKLNDYEDSRYFFRTKLPENITLGGIRKLAYELMNSSYFPNSIRKRKIINSEGKIAFISVANAKDKIVQTVTRILIEPIFEQDFLKVSYGFRPKKNCHSALSEVEKRWKQVRWFIECDVAKNFKTNCISIVLRLVRIKIYDFVLISTLKKFLKADYLSLTGLANSHLKAQGALQAPVLSSLLCNIYFHELDKFIVNIIIPRWNFLYKTKRQIRKTYQKVICSNHRFWKDITKNRMYPTIGSKLKSLRLRFLFKLRFFNYKYFFEQIGLQYIRYADDLILGFKGSIVDTSLIVRQICSYFEMFLKERINPLTFIIKHVEEGVVFLGYHVFGSRFQFASVFERRRLKFAVPIKKLLKNYSKRGFCKIARKGRNDKYVARRVDKWLFLTHDAEVVKRFNVIARGIAEYFSGSDFPAALFPIWLVLERSLALTLAHRHKQKSAKWAYKRFGKSLGIQINEEKTIAWIKPRGYRKKWKVGKSFQGQLSTIVDYPLLKENGVSNTILNVRIRHELQCVIPNCFNVADSWYFIKGRRKSITNATHKFLDSLSTKQIPVCKTHYISIQTGKYDGVSLKNLIGFSIDNKVNFFDGKNKNF